MVTVTVGVAVPNGIKIRLHAEHDEQEVTPNGYRNIKVWRPVPGAELTLEGNARHLVGNDPRSPGTYGYRIHHLT